MTKKHPNGVAASNYSQNTATASSTHARSCRVYRRRPDRHPFVVDVPGSLFFATRAMPQPNTRYSVIVGESFWRLATYIDSVPSRPEDRIPGKAPHVLLRGPPGCGKSFLVAAASALLGFGPASLRPEEFDSYLSADYRTIYIGDCRRWLESDDPLTYFRMELLRGLRDVSAPTETDDHHSPEHLGCILCVEPFTRVDQVRAFMERCCRWAAEYQPDTLFVFFIDQAEELAAKPHSVPSQIVQILLASVQPILCIFGVTSPFDNDFPWRSHCGLTLSMPYRANALEFNKYIELYSMTASAVASITGQEGGKGMGTGTAGSNMATSAVTPSKSCPILRDSNMIKEYRLWTGGIPVEISDLFGCATSAPGNASPSATLGAYRRSVAARVNHHLISIAALDGKQRNVLLIVLFAIILRIPMDMSGEFNLANILALGPHLTNLMLLDCLQTFYHTTDGIITLADVPAAINLATHLVLTSPNTLTAVCRNWPGLFENVVQAMVHSRLLCAESKRRMARFYAHAKLLWSRPDWRFEGVTETGETVRFKFRQARVVVFAGQTPPPAYFTDANEHHGAAATGGDWDAVAFIPGRTSYWFFDLLIYVPEDRRLYAVTTSAIVGSWLRDLGIRCGPLQAAQQRDEGILQPAILLDQWRDCLKRAGLPKVLVKCVVLKTLDLMTAAGYTPVAETDPGAGGTGTTAVAGDVARLARHLENAAVLKDEE